MKAEEIPVHRQFDVLQKIIRKLIENLKQMFKTSWCKTTYNLTQQPWWKPFKYNAKLVFLIGDWILPWSIRDFSAYELFFICIFLM